MAISLEELRGHLLKEWEHQIAEMGNLETQAEAEMEAKGNIETETRIRYAKVIGQANGLEHALSYLK